FACVGKQWRYGEARFRAEKYPFVALSLPVFAGIGEGVRGSLYAGSKAMDVSVELFRQATRVELESSGGADSDVLNGGIFKFDFECSPGFYEAVLKDSSGAVLERTAGIVNEPGKLKRRVHGLRLLEAGESIALTDDASIRSLRLLPGLSTSFALLVEATSDYSHCCCEQTAAKTLAACSMYMLASGDGGRKDKAESIIIAGIRRQESMWLEGRGFKSYPDYPSNPDQHYGPIASRHLWNLDLLLSGGKDLSPELKKWLGKGIEIARDTSVAYGIEMVPSDLKSCQDAYSAIRFANGNDNKSRSIEFIRRQLAKGTQDRRLPIIESSFHFLGGQVSYRIECAYAAAALIKAGESQDRRVALDLANEVISCFNEESRLYSTVDSVAAIALMSELEAARITGGGVVQFDGKELSISDALLSRTSPEKVKVVDGVAAVEVVKEVVEDWGSFSAGVAMRVALMTGGKVKRSFVPGELVELNIRLEDGCEEGDLIWVCLPEALSRLVGGGQVKLFSVDLK
ncbi:MAG: hypothetical protein K8F91_26915, partial [Candidatus Obscuribacterales bacterium]|nr:hypothetical protein [Candidatus Obscuribacterales bacterium]